MSHLRNVVCSLPSPELLSVCAHLVMAGLKVSRRYDAKKDRRSSPRLHPLREQLERSRDRLSSPRFLLRDNSYPDRGLRTINRRLMQDGKEPARAKLTPQSALRIPFLPRSHAHRQVARRVRVPARRTSGWRPRVSCAASCFSVTPSA